MNNQATQEKLTQMRLWGMQRAFRGVLEGGIGAKYTADELIGHLVDAEWDERHNRRLARLLKGARFRYQASFEQIDFRRARNLDKNLVLRLSDGSWVQEHRNVIVTGPTGVGKSFLCSAIGHQACLHGFKTRYFNCTKFFPQTRLWVADGSYLKQIDQIARTDVVIFDDFGLQHLDGPARLTLLEVLEDRVGRRSTVFASQLPVASWFQVIGDATIADAICDRLIHHSVRIDLQGESLRKPAGYSGGTMKVWPLLNRRCPDATWRARVARSQSELPTPDELAPPRALQCRAQHRAGRLLGRVRRTVAQTLIQRNDLRSSRAFGAVLCPAPGASLAAGRGASKCEPSEFKAARTGAAA